MIPGRLFLCIEIFLRLEVQRDMLFVFVRSSR